MNPFYQKRTEGITKTDILKADKDADLTDVPDNFCVHGLNDLDHAEGGDLSFFTTLLVSGNKYVEALKPFIDDKHGQKFAIEFTSKFIRKKGEVYLETQNRRIKPIYQSLFAQEVIFPKDEEIDYCQQMRKRHLYDENGNIVRQ